MEQKLRPEKASFFDCLTATRDRPLGFQIVVLVLVAAVLALALVTALLLL